MKINPEPEDSCREPLSIEEMWDKIERYSFFDACTKVCMDNGKAHNMSREETAILLAYHALCMKELTEEMLTNTAMLLSR